MDYTKGEWIFDNEILVVRAKPPRIEGICHIIYQKTLKATEANAHLIASAPDLYEACQLYISHQNGKRGHYCSVCHNEIEKALSKAEEK